MSSGRRITIALVGLVLLAVIGWLVKDAAGHAHSAPTPCSATAGRMVVQWGTQDGCRFSVNARMPS